MNIATLITGSNPTRRSVSPKTLSRTSFASFTPQRGDVHAVIQIVSGIVLNLRYQS